MHQDTDSDVAEQRDGGKVKVKWTQEEVIAWTCPSDLHIVSAYSHPVIMAVEADSRHKHAYFCVYRTTSSKRWFRKWDPMTGNILPAMYR